MINSSPSGRGQGYANVTYFWILDLEISLQQVASLLVWSTNSPTVSVWVRAGIRQVRGLCLVWSGPYSRILHLCSSWQDFDWHIASQFLALYKFVSMYVRSVKNSKHNTQQNKQTKKRRKTQLRFHAEVSKYLLSNFVTRFRHKSLVACQTKNILDDIWHDQHLLTYM